MGKLADHPFAVRAFFNCSVSICFAIPKEYLAALLPEPLELDSFDDKFGYVAMAFVDTKNLRPAVFPKLFGQNFKLIGYRIFAKYKNKEGKRLRGLYILRSETDKRQMKLLGNLFTSYNYECTDLEFQQRDQQFEIRSVNSQIDVKLELGRNSNIVEANPPLPINSPFSNWKEARRFAGPMPFTFTVNPIDRTVLIAEGKRQNWKPMPVEIISCQENYFDQLTIAKPIVASAFVVKNIEYRWEKGIVEKY